MLGWLVDNAATIYFVLGFIALVLVALWWRERKRPYLIGLGVVAGFVAVIFGLTCLIVTDRKRLAEICEEMAQGIRERSVDKVFRPNSPSFDQANRTPMNATQLRDLAQRHLPRRGVEDIAFAKFACESLDRDAGKARVQFWVLGVEDAEGMPVRCEADFVLEQTAWRMKGFKLFIGNTTNQYPFP
jgi:hypothetical protein